MYSLLSSIDRTGQENLGQMAGMFQKLHFFFFLSVSDYGTDMMSSLGASLALALFYIPENLSTIEEALENRFLMSWVGLPPSLTTALRW